MSSTEQDPKRGIGVSINDATGYPCPKDGAVLTLIEKEMPVGGLLEDRREVVRIGAWCPECHTVWREADDVPLADLDALPEVCICSAHRSHAECDVVCPCDGRAS